MALTLVLIAARPSYSANKIHLTYGGLDFSLGIDSLETYAKTGEINQELGFYTQALNEQTLLQLREWLQKPFKVDQVTISRLTNTALGVELLKEIGEVISTHSGRNGLYALRAALIEASAKPEWTIIDVLRQFPTNNIHIEGELLLQLKDELANFSDYRRAAVEAIALEANQENQPFSGVNLGQLEDLRETGSYQVSKQTLTITKNAIRQTRQGLSDVYTFDVDVYYPENYGQKAPIIVISHGFGSLRANFLRLAEHLASRGYVAAVPEHIGSDLDYRARMLAGDVDSVISPLEYTERPKDISYLLDEFENLAAKDDAWKERLDLSKIGVIGDSLGGTTVLSDAGATINPLRLKEECDTTTITLNVSMLLQCRASYLPPATYDLRDPRIKAVIATHPVTSGIFGPEGLSQITIPTMIVAGSGDIIASVVEEQIHPFIWLKTKEKYLVLLSPGTHFTSSQPPDNSGDLLPGFLVGKNRAQGSKFFRGLSVAFFEVYLKANSAYEPYLSTAYNKSLSNESLNIDVIKSLEPAQLESAYGAEPPQPIIPASVSPSLKPAQTDIITEIKKTGVLKVALRKDAAPFGYVDSQGKWTGLCVDLVDSFANYLTNSLGLSIPVETVKLESNLENRFELVAQGNVYLECGPNTIRTDLNNIAFSDPFFVSGTQFLVSKQKMTQVNPNLDLKNVKIGVSSQTTTETYITKNYPQAETISFNNSVSGTQILDQLKENKIDAFASDGVLLLSEIKTHSLSLEDYTLLPEIPLTCDFYGLVIPNNEPQWQKIVNGFVGDEMQRIIKDNELKQYLFKNLNYCFKSK